MEKYYKELRQQSFHTAYTMVPLLEERSMNTVILSKLFLSMMERKKFLDPTSNEFINIKI